jgi:hypothetical protein
MFQEALRQCLAFLEEGSLSDQGEFAGIEAFCQAHVDEPLLQQLQAALACGGNGAGGSTSGTGLRPQPGRRRRPPDGQRNDGTWVLEAYRRMCTLLETEIVARAVVDENVATQFCDYFRERTRDWGKQWGYESVRLLRPDQQVHRTDQVALHCLRFHAREILYQLLIGEVQGDVQLQQAEQEQAQVAAVLRSLDESIAVGDQLCRDYRIGGSA